MRLLLVEDDVMVASGIKLGLTNAGYAVDWVGSGERGEEVLRTEVFDAAIIDIGLPHMDGLELTKKLRRADMASHAMPVLILTARDALQDRVQGLDLGADDYMIKPFELPELLARLRALLRRSQAATTAVLTFGPIELDTANRRANARHDGQVHLIELGPREWTVLEYLLINAPKPASKDKLLQALTGWDKEITPNAVEVYISRLRGKLEPYGVALRSIRGFGYRLELLIAPLTLLAMMNAWIEYRSADNVAVQQDQRLLSLIPLVADSVIGQSSERPLLMLAPPLEEFLKQRPGSATYAILDAD